MNTPIRLTFVVAFFVAATVLLFFGGGMATGPLIGGGLLMKLHNVEICWPWFLVLGILTAAVIHFSGILEGDE